MPRIETFLGELGGIDMELFDILLHETITEHQNSIRCDQSSRFYRKTYPSGSLAKLASASVIFLSSSAKAHFASAE